MTNQEAIEFLSQIMDMLLASNSWLPSTDNPIKESFGMAINALTAQPETHACDCVSRQAAIDALDEIEAEVADGYGYQYAKWREYFVEMPSAQPEPWEGKQDANR